jgi:nucleoside-triphosphatase THEP1
MTDQLPIQNEVSVVEPHKRQLKFKNMLYREVWANVHRKKRNAMICVVGRVGTGKSYVALRIAEQLDPTFTAETIRERVVTTPEQFMNLISRTAGKLKKGSVIVVDEASTQMYNRKWQSVNNIAINFIITTFRNKRLICIFTLPYMTFLDAHVRKMFDYYVETQKIDFAKKQTRAKVFELSYDKMKGSEPYKKYLRKKDEYGVYGPIKKNYFGKPSKELADAYEKYADEFKKTIQDTAIASVEKEHIKEEMKDFNPQPIVDAIIKDLDKYAKIWRGRKQLNINKIMVDFSIGYRRAENIRELVAKQVELNLKSF